MIQGKRVVVVLPAYNAEQTLVQTLADIPRDVVDELLLVDDASHDNTARLARSLGLKTLVHPSNLGYGGNQKTCYTAALAAGADIVVMVHPDYQYDPRLVPALATPLASEVYDIMLGSRIIGNGALRGGMPRYKYVSNRLLTAVQNILLGEKLSEYHTGYRAFSRRVLETLPLETNSDDFLFDNQVLAQAFYFGFRIGEISCPTRYAAESSSIDFGRSCEYGLGVLWTSVQFRLARLGMAKPRIFDSAGPRLRLDRLAERITAKAPEPVPAARQETRRRPAETLPATRSGGGVTPRSALRYLIAFLILVSIIPVVPSWRLISAYAAVPTRQVRAERDVALASPNLQPMSAGRGLAVGPDGALFVTDFDGRRLLAFPDGTSGSGFLIAPQPGQEPLRSAYALALGPDGTINVLDRATGVVASYDQSGALLRAARLGSPGAAAITVDSEDSIFIGDTLAGVIRKYLASGEPDSTWGDIAAPATIRIDTVVGLAADGDDLFAASDSRRVVVRFDRDGRLRAGQRPLGNAGMLTAAPNGLLYMSDSTTDRVWILD